jgi:hypothetical protein
MALAGPLRAPRICLLHHFRGSNRHWWPRVASQRQLEGYGVVSWVRYCEQQIRIIGVRNARFCQHVGGARRDDKLSRDGPRVTIELDLHPEFGTALINSAETSRWAIIGHAHRSL